MIVEVCERNEMKYVQLLWFSSIIFSFLSKNAIVLFSVSRSFDNIGGA